MAEKLPGTIRNRLIAALDTWQDWPVGLAGRPQVTKQLEGFSNASFLISDGKVDLVLRLNGESTQFGVDRTLERELLRHLADRPFAPTLVHWDQARDFMLTRYTPGHHIPATDIMTRLEDIATLFRNIHDTGIPDHAPLDPYEQARRYFDRLASPDPRVTRCFEALLLEPVTAPFDHCLCHHDLLLENIVESPSGLVALDWEYARLGDPAFDLAVFVESYRLDGHAAGRLLNAYGASTELAARVDPFRALYALIEVLWWLLRDPDRTFIAERLDRLEQFL